MRRPLALVIVSALVAPATLLAAGWGSYKPGTWIKTRTTILVKYGEGGEARTRKDTTTRLVEINDKEAIVEDESESTNNVAGKEFKSSATKSTRSESLTVPVITMPSPAPSAMPGGAQAGEEFLAVGSQRVKCHWIQFSIAQGPNKTTTKTWTSPEVPGGTVRTEFRTEGAQTTENVVELVDFEIQK